MAGFKTNIDNLYHSIEEVRKIALTSLLQKLQCSTVNISKLLCEPNFLSGILKNLEDKNQVLVTLCLEILVYVFKDETGLALLKSGDKSSRIQKACHQIPSSDLTLKIKRLMNQNDSVIARGDVSSQSASRVSSLKSELSKIDRTVFDDSEASTLEKRSEIGDAIHLQNFPWIPLSQLDKQTIESHSQVLSHKSGKEFLSCLYFWESTLFLDFPVEVFLQRPLVFQVLLGCLEKPFEKSDSSWRLQEIACHCLYKLTVLLETKIKEYEICHENRLATSTHSSLACNTQSQEAIKESFPKDVYSEDEFVIIGLHQMTVPSFCCSIMNSTVPLLDSIHVRLSKELFKLILKTIDILTMCISFDEVAVLVQDRSHEQWEVLNEITSCIIKAFNIISRCIVELYEINPQSTDYIEETTMRKKNVIYVFAKLIENFLSEESYFMVVSDDVTKAFTQLLSDPLVFFSFPDEYHVILGLIKETDQHIYHQYSLQVKAVHKMANLRSFLQMSSSKIEEFLSEAEECLPLFVAHKSQLFVEKLIQGLSKQWYQSNMVNQTHTTRLVLKLLHFPDTECQFLCYKSVLNLVTKCIRMTEAVDTKLTKSYLCLMLLQPRIFNSLIFYGSTHLNKRISEISQTILLTLIRGTKLMAPPVLKTTLDTMQCCFLNLQLLSSANSQLGRAVLNLPHFLNSEEVLLDELQCLKFHLRGLFSKEKEVRELSFRNAVSFALVSQDEFVCPPLSEIDMEQDAHMFMFSQETNVWASEVENPDSFEKCKSLEKIVELLKNDSLDADLRTSVWKQFAFLLQNPCVHNELPRIYPVAMILQDFLSMMKASGGKNVTISQVPAAFEVILWCLVWSEEFRELCNQPDILKAFFKAALFFRKSPAISEARLLLSILLFNDHIEGKSMPKLVSTNHHIPFKHGFYDWSIDSDDLTVSLSKLDNTFFKISWGVYCINNINCTPKDSAISDLFTLSNAELDFIVFGQNSLHIQKILSNIEGSGKKNVKSYLNKLEAILSRSTSRVHGKWSESLSQYLLLAPSVAQDKQNIFHLLNTITQLLKVLSYEFEEGDCSTCSFIDILTGELSKEDSALVKMFTASGKVNWTHSKTDMQIIQCKLTYQSTLEMVSALLLFSQNKKCKCTLNVNWSSMFSNIMEKLWKIISYCQNIPQFNLPIHVPTLELLVKISQVYDINEDQSVQIIVQLTRFMCELNEGRSPKHHIMLGRSINIRCLLLMSVVFSKATVNYPQTNWTELVETNSPSLVWLSVALQHSDPYTVNSALKFCISLTSAIDGAELLERSLKDIHGGIWQFIFSLFLHDNTENCVRLSSCHVLLNLSKCLLVNPDALLGGCFAFSQQNNPEDIFLEACIRNNLFGFMRKIFRCIDITDVDKTDVFMHSQQLENFVETERSQWVSELDAYEEDESTFHVSVYLIESSISLLMNCLRIDYDLISNEISASHLFNVLVQKLSLIGTEVKLIGVFGGIIEASFKLLIQLGEPYVSNTHLAQLAISAFTHGTKSSLLSASLRLVSGMISSGSWRSVRILELLLTDPQQFTKNLIHVFHHANIHEKYDALIFIIELCSAGNDHSESDDFVQLNRNEFLSTIYTNETDEPHSIGWEICQHLLQLLPLKTHPNLPLEYIQNDAESVQLDALFEAIKLMLLTKDAQNCAFKHYMPLLNILQFSLDNLWQKILSVNLHITSNIMNVKDLKSHLAFTMHCLKIATNWIYCANLSTSLIDVCEVLIPLVHPLWIAALRGHPLMECMLDFLMAATSHETVCGILTRTSTTPGATLSTSRTTKSLLNCLITSTTQIISRRDKPCDNDCGVLPQGCFKSSLDILMNCSRSHDSAYVIVKQSFVKTSFNYLNRSNNGKEAYRIMQILSAITDHPEARASLAKVPQWVKILQSYLQSEDCVKYVLIIYINMIRNHQYAKNILTTEDFLSNLCDVIQEASDTLVYKKENVYDEESLHLILVIVWSLLANNKKCKSILKKQNIVPHLDELCQFQRHLPVCKFINHIMESDE